MYDYFFELQNLKFSRIAKRLMHYPSCPPSYLIIVLVYLLYHLYFYNIYLTLQLKI